MIGNRIRQAREGAGLTQEQCARLAGIDPSVYNRIENNKREPTASELLRLLRVLKATPAALLGIEEAPVRNGNASSGSNSDAAKPAPTADAVVLLAHAVLEMVKRQMRRTGRRARAAARHAGRRKPPRGGVINSFPATYVVLPETSICVGHAGHALTAPMRNVRAA